MADDVRDMSDVPDLPATRRLTGDGRTFVDRLWGSRMHLHRGDSSDLAGLLTVDDVDHLVTSTAIRTPSVRLARDGSVLATSCFTRRASLAGKPLTGLVDPRRLLAEFEDGATVVLQGLQRSWSPVIDLVAALESELGHPGQANAYLTPPDSRGFALHADSHDVFVVQTHGRKHWEVHDGEGIHELVLSPGDVLYLPTGTRHAARAMGEASLHLTIGIRAITWRAVLDRALRGVLDDLDDLDEPLPAGWLEEPDGVSVPLEKRLRRIADALEGVDHDAVTADEADRFRTSRPTRMSGGLRDVLAAPGMGDDTVVRRRPGHVAALRDDDDHVTVLLGDRELRVPAWVRPALQEAVSRDELRPRDLARWLDVDSRRVLVRRLVREGLFTIQA